MNRDKLQKRAHIIKGGDKKLYPLPVKAMRRGKNHVENVEEINELKFDNFFEYEKDLSELESAREQALKSHIDEGGHYEPGKFKDDLSEFRDSIIINTNNGIIMEELSSEEASPIVMEEADNVKPAVKAVAFKQCSFIKTDGKRCKRQAPKQNEYCAAHRKNNK